MVRTGGLNFSPEPDGDRVVLGSVGIEQADPLRRAIIGFAPVLIGTALIAFSVFYFLSDGSFLSFPWNFVLAFLIVFEVGNTMFSSRRDLEGSATLAFILSISVITSYFLGFSIPEGIVSYFNSESFVEIVKKGIWVLLFPITIDTAIILLSIALNRKSASNK